MFLELLHNESYNSMARLGKYYVVKLGEGGIFWENKESFHNMATAIYNSKDSWFWQ